MHNYIIESLLLGLSVGPVCLAYCSPIVVPLLSTSQSPKLSVGSLTLFTFLTGRYLGYMLTAMAVGIVGNNIHHYVDGMAFAIISIVLGLVLLFFSIQKNFPQTKFCRILKRGNSQTLFLTLLGLLTGLNFCPPFLAAIVGATSTGTVAGSMIYFSAFFIGTVVFFPAMVLLGLLSRIESVRIVANICLMISGFWFVLKGILIVLSS